jgi:hypothetical protein
MRVTQKPTNVAEQTWITNLRDQANCAPTWDFAVTLESGVESIQRGMIQ